MPLYLRPRRPRRKAQAGDAGVAQLVERNLAKVEVESSRLFSRSRQENREASASLFHRVDVVGARVRRPRRWRGSKAVMHRIANPSRSVRLRPAPPSRLVAVRYLAKARPAAFRVSAGLPMQHLVARVRALHPTIAPPDESLSRDSRIGMSEARVAKSVDAAGLKPVAEEACGFESRPGYQGSDGGWLAPLRRPTEPKGNP